MYLFSQIQSIQIDGPRCITIFHARHNYNLPIKRPGIAIHYPFDINFMVKLKHK